jgi:deferrochelatase/peroxidase EfeB
MSQASASLQEGIFLAPSSPPPPAWRLVFLDVAAGTTPTGAREALGCVVGMLTALQRGELRDLRATRPDEASGSVPADSFQALLGFGASLFDAARHDPPLTSAQRPAHLVALRRSGRAFPSLPWKACDCHGGEADVALQLTGSSEHSVDRAAVEVAKLIADQGLPLTLAGSYDGFQRDDGRSWIGFHDGVSNIEPSQRAAAVVSEGDPVWNRGGTYLAYLRIEIALEPWRALGREAQEAIVGRDKLSGSPLVAVDTTGGKLRPRTLEACPMSDSGEWWRQDAFFNPPESADPLVEASHVHRVNQNRGAGSTSAGHRIFRQGYEYLEALGPDGPRLGLNFVSFQSELEHVQQVLGLQGWLGDVNFGGPTFPRAGDPKPPDLMSLRAGGFYAVPPRERPFAGASLFV